MRQHHSLGFASRSGSIDDRREVRRLDRCERILENVGIDPGEGIAFFFDGGERNGPAVTLGNKVVLNKNESFEPFNTLDGALGVFPEFLAGDKEHLRSGVFDDKPDLFDGLSGIDGNVDGPERQYCQVNERPFGTILRYYSHAIAGFNTERGQPHGDPFNTFDNVPAVDVVPNAFDLKCKGVPFVISPEGLKTEMGYRLWNTIEPVQVICNC